MIMVYTPKFITSLTKIVNLSFGKITLASLNDDVVQIGEERLIDDLAVGKHFIGSAVLYTDLLTLDRVAFSRMLEYAAIYAVMAWYNQQGLNNKAVGPIIGASGDGMAKTQGYYTSKKLNNDALVTAEENYLAKLKDIYRYYSMKKGGKIMISNRHNEFYDQDYNANLTSNRKVTGNEYNDV